MPKIIAFGGLDDEQATGPILNNGLMHIYFARQDDPTSLYYLGGHRFDDAPTYTNSDAKIVPRYRQSKGRNIVEEETLTYGYVKSIQFTLALPNRLISVADKIYQLQQQCKFDMLIYPDDCNSGCDEFFWVFKDAQLGAKNITATPVGYDENEGHITTTRTVASTGQMVEYHGLQETVMYDDDTYDFYGVTVVEETCVGCGCPNKEVHAVGRVAGTDLPIHVFTTDGGANWTVQDGGVGNPLAAIQTVLTTGSLTDIKFYNGRLFITFATAYQTTGATAGGIAYSVDNGLTWTIATDDVGDALNTVGFNQIVSAFGKIWAFGSDGYAYRSCDDGATFEQYSVASDLPADTEWFAADVDSRNNLIFLGGDDGTAYTFDGSTWTNITTEVGADAAADFHEVRVSSPGHILYGTSDGELIETFKYVQGATNAWVHTNLGNDVDAIGPDSLSYRVVVAHATNVALRDAYNDQNMESAYSTSDGNITDFYVPEALLDEGENAFFFVNDDGQVGRYAQCFECLEGGC